MEVGLDALLKTSVEKGASDLHLKMGNHPVVRIDGSLYPLTECQKLSQADVARLGFSILSPGQKERLLNVCEVDLAYSVPSLGRFRVSLFQQRGAIGLTCRLIPFNILSVSDLLLPPIVEKLANERRGLILTTGSMGSGKSTTLAAMLDYINQHQRINIVTIEDPIEFIHADKKALVSQREVGHDTESFTTGLRSCFRQDANVIMVGEMRDFETISTVLTAAETGHLVLSTLHTIDATETVNRIISSFPTHQQQQTRIQLASVLKGVISMRLIQRANRKGRVPAVEVLVATQTVQEAIMDPQNAQLHDIISAGKSQYGMQTFDQSLYDLFTQKLISYEDALKGSTRPSDFALKVAGVQSGQDRWGEEKPAQTQGKAPGKPSSVIGGF